MLGYHQYVISYVLPVHLIQKYIVIQHRRSLIFVTHKNLQVDMEYKDQHKPLFLRCLIFLIDRTALREFL